MSCSRRYKSFVFCDRLIIPAGEGKEIATAVTKGFLERRVDDEHS